MKVTGRCHCGQISFEAEIDPAQVRICHCTDCQTLTGTAFRTNVSSLPGTFVLRSGTPKTYIKTAESGNKRAHGFCPECGTPIYSTAPGANPASYGLRVGALDRRAELRPTKQGWCRSALPWSMNITGVERFERQPQGPVIGQRIEDPQNGARAALRFAFTSAGMSTPICCAGD